MLCPQLGAPTCNLRMVKTVVDTAESASTTSGMHLQPEVQVMLAAPTSRQDVR